ncbi:hypothetical protein [Campylobacter sp. RM16192]|uniref:hypothetical protein n=1 Tax=Campylobacter sp. RM16192 TaxID=1660080 RepID=UPI00145168AD|nr:hypothetical protein [Campylobacter sp. RM16192]QCD51835.1 hypothetical protein CDOMC_0169 [Campylobacter sp. RM16192]
MQEKIEQTIKKTIISLKDEAVDLNDQIFLFGRNDALFDSVGLVGFLIELEEKIYDEFGKNITLADEKAMSQKTSPFINIKTLTKYIQKCLNE